MQTNLVGRLAIGLSVVCLVLIQDNEASAQGLFQRLRCRSNGRKCVEVPQCCDSRSVMHTSGDIVILGVAPGPVICNYQGKCCVHFSGTINDDSTHGKVARVFVGQCGSCETSSDPCCNAMNKANPGWVEGTVRPRTGSSYVTFPQLSGPSDPRCVTCGTPVTFCIWVIYEDDYKQCVDTFLFDSDEWCTKCIPYCFNCR